MLSSSRAFAWRLTLVLGLCLASSPLATGADTETSDEPKKLKVLLVTGGCCHDYPNQETILRQGLGERLGDIEWTVVNYGKDRTADVEVYAKADWPSGYDLVIHNECYGGVEDPAVINRIVEGHYATKVPAVAIHCSLHSYRHAENADRWRELLGVTSTYHEKKNRSLTVVPAVENEPILADLPNPWKTPNGELYIILKTWPGVRVLASAYSEEEEGDQPVIWTNEKNGVRLLGISLGHHNETMSDKPYLDVLAAGIRWTLADRGQ